jgi:NADH:ubiquinone oxidoreductase subunit F (NADH-binding)
MGRRRIARMVAAGEYEMTRHAYDQMIARDIFIKQVEDAVLNGRVAARWPDRDGERLAIIGERFNGDFIKVVVKDCQIPKVITVCYPYEKID